MGVSLTNKGTALKKTVGPSNKHGLTGFPEAYSVTLPDGRTIYVSRPQIDKIALLADIPQAVYGYGDDEASGPAQFKEVFEQAMDGTEGGLKKAPQGKSSFSKGWPQPGEMRGRMRVGPRGAKVDVSAQPQGQHKNPTGWKLRMEWNPRKTGPSAVERLLALLACHLHFGPENAAEWMRTAKVTRLDIAVDLVGLERTELYVRLPDQKKLKTYGQFGHGIETTNHHLGDGKTGSATMSVYDKRQEQRDKKKVPKFGALPHQRIERRYNAMANFDVQLFALADLPDLLEGPLVRLMRDLPNGPTKLDQQLAAAATLWFGWNALSTTLTGGPLAAWKLMKVTPDNTFWDPAQIWSHWPAAVADAGLKID